MDDCKSFYETIEEQFSWHLFLWLEGRRRAIREAYYEMFDPDSGLWVK